MLFVFCAVFALAPLNQILAPIPVGPTWQDKLFFALLMFGPLIIFPLAIGFMFLRAAVDDAELIASKERQSKNIFLSNSRIRNSSLFRRNDRHDLN